MVYCPICSAEMDIDEDCEMSFDDEDTIVMEVIYHCDNCRKSFKYSETFEKVSSEFRYEVEN